MFVNKRVLVTGCCGTVGSVLIKQLLLNQKYSPLEVIGIDNDESGLFFQDQMYLRDDHVRFYLCDIRDQQSLINHTEGIDVIFHAAALKHVILGEKSPDQVVQTNIIGVQNIIVAAKKNAVEKVIFTSSDKAVNPTNVMGTSKLMGERLMTAANSHKRGVGPVFVSTRFGNILGSSGSVVEIFKKQIAEGREVTLTDESMTRFVMTVDAAVELLIDTYSIAQGGEVFVTKMPVIKIKDLAYAMINEIAPMYEYQPEAIKVVEIGPKPGEKMYEELMSEEEIRRGIELTNYFSILPAFRGVYHEASYSYSDVVSEKIEKAYVSRDEPLLSIDEIKDMLGSCCPFGEA